MLVIRIGFPIAYVRHENTQQDTVELVISYRVLKKYATRKRSSSSDSSSKDLSSLCGEIRQWSSPL